MTTLIKFLKARLDEDEAAARAWPADQHDWKDAGNRYLSYASGCGEQVGAVNVGGDYYGWERIYIKSNLDDQVAHLTRHDPARVLREVSAKRKIVEAASITLDIYTGFSPFMDFITETLRRLASAWDEHPDYDQEWRPFGEAHREEWKP